MDFLKTHLFYIVLILHCLVGGAIAFTGVIPFRPFFASLLVLLSVAIYKIKIDNILKFHTWFVFTILLSGIINGSSVNGMLMAMRVPVISYTMYLVVVGYLGKQKVDIEWLIKVIAIIQLPIIITQIILYEPLASLSAVYTSFNDIRYGTFFVKSDPTMSTFLILVVIYLLFVKKDFNKWNVIVILSACLSVFLASSRISQIALLMILGYYVFLNASFKQKAYAVPIIGLVLLAFSLTGYYSQLQFQLTQVWKQITFQQGVDYEAFREGGYARGATILYFLSEPLKILGDGPGQYVNPLANEMSLGLQGEYFKTYAELGLVGLLFSVGGIFIIVFSKLKKGFYRYLIVFTLLTLGITSDLYNDAGLMFIFYLMIYVILNSKKVSEKKFWLIKS